MPTENLGELKYHSYSRAFPQTGIDGMNKIEHKTLNDRAYDEIKTGLITGRFAPGQILVIRTLAETYGISATPVREALQRLVAERMLEVLPNRSIAVPDLTVEKFVELARIRAALEGLAAELAAPRFGPADLRALSRLIEDIDEAIAAGDGKAYVTLNQQFHFSLYERAGAPQLLRLIQDMWGQVGPFFNGLFDDVDYIGRANEQHLEIVRALADGDAAAARLHVVRDIEVAAESLLPRLTGLGG